MKRVWIGLLTICMVLGSGLGFATSELEAEIVPTVLDERISEFYVGDFLPGDVKYLSDGNVVIQTLETFYNGQMEVLKVDQNGDPVKNRSVKKFWLPGVWYFSPVFRNFLFEDIDGNIYTLAEAKVMEISPDFTSTKVYEEFPPFWLDVDSKGRTIINLIWGFGHRGNPVLEALTYEEGESPADFNKMREVLYEGVLASLDIENGSLGGVDFAKDEDELYLLIGSGEGESRKWIIAKTSMVRVPVDSADQGKSEYMLELEETIVLDGAFDGHSLVGIEYTGDEFHITGMPYDDSLMVIHRVDMDGMIQESVNLPGMVKHFDSKENETIVSVMQLYQHAERVGGYYKIVWEKNPSEWEKKPSVGSPSRLIRERSFGGKTTAVFRDGGYGLLQKNEDEMGAIDYLAPLRTKESDVRLRMPLNDVFTRLGGSARNLEILFGEDRISIPMAALAVQDLLAQMPCETDATIEIHLVRGEDGTINVTAELFVVEQVDSMTRLVHRRAIDLP